MFQRIQQYPLISSGVRVYRPRAYAHPQTDGTYDGWLVFFPVGGGTAIASDRETTQSSFDALVTWASRLSDVYLAGALERAERIATQPPLLSTLARAEYDALYTAERLETSATGKRIAADADDLAANDAREAAEQLQRERVGVEQELVAREEAEAISRERDQKELRDIVADAGERKPRRRKND